MDVGDDEHCHEEEASRGGEQASRGELPGAHGPAQDASDAVQRDERPDQDDPDGGGRQDGGAAAGAPTLRVAAVARRLGVAPATLRTWARRYRLGPSAHTAGAHRQYSLEDLERLMVMRRLTLEGYSPAEAARVALQPALQSALQPAPLPDPLPATPPGGREQPAGPGSPAPAGAGRAASGSATPSVRSLARAAMALQSQECLRQLEAHLAVNGVLETWTALARPVLQALAGRTAAVSPGRSPGHLLEGALLSGLTGLVEAEPPASGPAVLVALARRGGEDVLGHVVGTALREAGAAAQVLQGAHPAELVAAVAEQVDAAFLVLVAEEPVGEADRAEAARLADPALARLVLVGRGWEGGAHPATAQHVPELADVVPTVLG